jgi:hydroxymethylpyrimidine pyrophosphatase-like HAD family hydrolase
MEKIACIDFDGTITNFSYPEMGEPQKGVKEALQRLKDLGYTIHILSCRTSIDVNKHPIDRTMAVRDMEDYLKKHEIPFDQVLNKDKPIAHYYIDDRAIGFRNDWEEVIKEIKDLSYD